jgi:hypothetical protein
MIRKIKISKITAFSLIEVSFVLLVLSILIGGAIKGSRLIGAYHLGTAKSLTNSSPVQGTKDLAFWIETSSDGNFDSSVDDGSAVANWYDINTNSNKVNLNQAVSDNQPRFKRIGIGHIPSIEFDGTDDFLRGDGLRITSDVTLFIVFKMYPNALSSSSIDLMSIFYDPDSNNTNETGLHGIITEISQTSGTLRFVYRTPISADAALGDNNFSTSTVSANKDYILSATRNYQDSSLTIWLNNIAYIGGGATTPSVTGGAFNYSDLSIIVASLADYPSMIRAFKGLISEIIIFNRALDQDEIDNIETYLSKKYKISI